MFEYLILLLPILVVVAGIIYLGIFFYNTVIKSKSIVDETHECLYSDPDKIRLISKKYGSRIRGSVRLSQGRMKSCEEIKNKEKDIVFP